MDRASPLAAGERRVFVRDGLRSYRRTYRVSEARWGAAIGLGLLGILAWVSYRGAHPDPSLFDMSAALRTEGAGNTAPQLGAATPPPGTAESARGAERGALPEGLGSASFREGKVGAYTPENLYVKIDGRAEFFASFGVKSMHTITLESALGDGVSVDIELYDLGEARNALGAYQGERPPGMQSTVEDGSTFHFDRNSGFLTRGSYYVRVIGSDESAAVVGEVKRLINVFREKLAAGELPWAFGLFVDQMKLHPGQVSYQPENAFSFGFARDVYKAALSAADSKEDMEAFVSVKADAGAAIAEVAKYQNAFRDAGADAGHTPAGVALFKDEFLGSFSGANASERWVFGVHGAPTAERAAEVLEQLKAGLAALPEAIRARAQPSAAPSSEGAGAESSAGPGANPAPAAGPAAGAAGPDPEAGRERGNSKPVLEGASHEQ